MGQDNMGIRGPRKYYLRLVKEGQGRFVQDLQLAYHMSSPQEGGKIFPIRIEVVAAEHDCGLHQGEEGRTGGRF